MPGAVEEPGIPEGTAYGLFLGGAQTFKEERRQENQ